MNLNFSNSYQHNQKEVIRNWVLNFIKDHKIESMLDIGAGFLETAKYFNEAVKNYLAIEQDSKKL